MSRVLIFANGACYVMACTRTAGGQTLTQAPVLRFVGRQTNASAG